ncbi:MAG: HupE/UreJ family protein [Gammaproteobacteria bacterium]|nr:HupE/UreJ family protein [Gammaproteobacteria bacterium]
MLSIFKESRWFIVILTMLVASQALGHGMSEAEKQTIIEGGNLRYIWIGATHMLSGYDHLAFIFGIIFFLTRFKDIVKYITAFTLGHSITLIYATFTALQVNYFLIDAVIALSVCYIAFANLKGFEKYLNVKAPNMMAMILGLGLIHGLGLSTRLQQLPLSEDNLLMNIISFNVGIELGQISALAVMLVLIAAFRKSHAFKSFTKAANSFLIIAGGYLFLMQMHGYEHVANAEEFVSKAEPTQAIQKDETINRTDWKDVITITIPARGDKEYKLLFAKGTTFEYSWETNGAKLFYDFHGEPKDDKTGYFKSFKKNTESKSSGTLTTLFEGTHGWYWKNSTSSAVEIVLKINGNYQRLDLVKKQKIKPEQMNSNKQHDSIF